MQQISEIVVDIEWQKFTERERKFIEHYLKHGVKIKAYKHAYSTDNMLTNTMHRNANFLCNKPKMKRVMDKIHQESVRRATVKVNEIIDARVAETVERTLEVHEHIIDAEWVKQRAALLADFNIGKFIKIDADTGTPCYDFSQATNDDWYCIQSYKVKFKSDSLKVPFEDIELKSYDKLRALQLVGQHVDVQAFREQVGVGNPDGTNLSKMSDKELMDAIGDLQKQAEEPESDAD